MKHTFLLLVGTIFLGCAGNYTLMEDNIEFQRVIEVTGGQDTLFPKALQWLAKTYNDSKEVIEYEDKAEGKIIGRGSTQVLWNPTGLSPASINIKYSITIEIKDNKARITIGNFYHPGFQGAPIYQDSYNRLVPILETMVVNFKSYLSKEEEKW